MMTLGNAEQIARELGKAKRVGGQWAALCPAHDDHDPSLTVADGDSGTLLVRCQAGCSQDQVIGALRSRGLWCDPVSPQPRPKKLNGNGVHQNNGESWRPIVPPPQDAPKPTMRQLQCDMLHECLRCR